MWIDPRQREHGSDQDLLAARLIWTLFALSLFGLGAYLFFLSFGQAGSAELAARARWLGPAIMLIALLLKPGWIVQAFVFIVNRFQRSGP